MTGPSTNCIRVVVSFSAVVLWAIGAQVRAVDFGAKWRSGLPPQGRADH